MNNYNVGEKQYLVICQDVIENGVWVENKRTGKKCLTGRTVIMTYDVGNKEYPMVTTRKVFPKMTLAEPVGYWQGLTSAEDFRKLGTKSWDANSNKTEAWLENPLRKGEDDCGKIYGAVGHDFNGVDLFDKVVSNLSKGIDDRGEIITYWNPSVFNEGCLRPCLHSLQFNLLGDTLDMTAIQRSCDLPLGIVANMQQCYVMLELMSRITGHKAGVVTHVLNQPHIYEDQVELMKEQLKREPIECSPQLHICESIQTWGDIMDLKDMKKFTITGYESHDRIDFPFSE